MAKSIEDIRNMVRSFIDEPIPADWTDAELNALVNARYHKLYSAAVDTYENYAETKVTTTDIVAGQQEYETQLDFMKMRRVEVNYSENSIAYSRAFPISLDQVRRQLDNSNVSVSTVRTPNYYLRGNVIGIIPVPQLDVVDGIKSWYYATVADLVDDSDLITLPYADRDWLTIAYGAAADALTFGQQEMGAAGDMEAKYEQGVRIMQQQLEDRVSDEYKGVIDATGDGLNFAEWGY